MALRERIQREVEELSKLGETELAPLSQYIKYGVHIGTNRVTADMRRFVYKKRAGVWLINVVKTDERIRLAARLLSLYRPEEVAVFAARLYAQKPAMLFCKYTGFKCFAGRMIPGTLTNPDLVVYCEPEIILVEDPAKEHQAISEAVRRGIPVMALCDTNNTLTYVDFVIPCNNKGRKALAFVFWLLTVAVLRERGQLAPDQVLDVPPEEFMMMLA